MGLRRSDVYIANVIKCRPPNNRNPEPDEVEQCEPFLLRQIDTVKPRVIVALGKFGAQCLLKTNAPITRLRGQDFKYRDAILIPTYHPAYLLRTPSAKREVWEDAVRAIIPELRIVVITHADIPGYMPGMTMGFRMVAPAIPETLSVGDAVRFTVRGSPPLVVLTAIEKDR